MHVVGNNLTRSGVDNFMDIHPIRSAISLPLASFLVLAILVHFGRSGPGAEGVPVSLAVVKACPEDAVIDSRDEVFQVQIRGGLRLNEESFTAQTAVPQVQQIMATRAERALFIVADEDVPWGQLMRWSSDLKASTDDLHLALITNKELSKLHDPVMPPGIDTPCRFLYFPWSAVR